MDDTGRTWPSFVIFISRAGLAIPSGFMPTIVAPRRFEPANKTRRNWCSFESRSSEHPKNRTDMAEMADGSVILE